MTEINIKKRSGELVPLDVNKIHKMLEMCANGLNVSVSDTAINAHIKFTSKIKSSDIQQTLIRSASEKISVDNPDYSVFAGRLLVTHMRKIVYGGYEPIPFYEYIQQNVKRKIYDPAILEAYPKDEIEELGTFLDYDDDLNRSYSSITQLESKYLIKDVKTDDILEMPQETFMLIPMVIFKNEDNRKRLIIEFYSALKNDEISLPTPVITGVRTRLKMFSSCCKIKMGDSTESILSTEYAASIMTSLRAGIGIDVGPVRGILAPVKNNTVRHTGALPILKTIEACTKQFTQNSLRTGATVVNYPFFNWEIMDILEYKNNQGSNTTRARFIDYSIGLNGLFIKRALSKQDITLFSAEEVPELFKYYNDIEKFEEAYKMYENKRGIRKRKVLANDIFNKLVKERVSTGRIYIHFFDNVNQQGMFKEPITQTNLCVAGDTKVTVQYEENNTLVSNVIDIEMLQEVIDSYKNVKVLSYNIQSGVREYKDVIAFAQTHKQANVVEIEDTISGKKITCTPDHEVYTINRGYVKASELKAEDELVIR
jgi:ribonucleoside-diphosphate reductase alpha chain